MHKTFAFINIIFTITANIQPPRDECPYDQRYPGGYWRCWAIECPGHQYIAGGLGCETNLLSELGKAFVLKYNL